MTKVGEKSDGESGVGPEKTSEKWDAGDLVSEILNAVASGDPFKAAVSAEGLFNVLSAAVVPPYEDFGEFIDFMISEARSRLSPASNRRIDVFEDAMIKLKKSRDR